MQLSCLRAYVPTTVIHIWAPKHRKFYLAAITTMFLHPGNFFHKEGTLSFLKDEVPLSDSFNHILLPKCWCTPNTTHLSLKERDYCIC